MRGTHDILILLLAIAGHGENSSQQEDFQNRSKEWRHDLVLREWAVMTEVRFHLGLTASVNKSLEQSSNFRLLFYGLGKKGRSCLFLDVIQLAQNLSPCVF